MDVSPLEELPLAQRLALSYAPGGVRDDLLTLLLLDNRLSAILRQKGEVMITQIKLAWWRDRLGEDPSIWPQGEPLLERLKHLPFAPAGLVPLVDGWERLLDEELGEDALRDFAQGRAVPWLKVATGEGVCATAQSWALTDLALNLNPGEERAAVAEAARLIPVKPGLPRAVRPLAVLHTLGRRAIHRDTDDLLDGPGAMLVALRIGMIGR